MRDPTDSVPRCQQGKTQRFRGGQLTERSTWRVVDEKKNMAFPPRWGESAWRPWYGRVRMVDGGASSPRALVELDGSNDEVGRASHGIIAASMPFPSCLTRAEVVPSSCRVEGDSMTAPERSSVLSDGHDSSDMRQLQDRTTADEKADGARSRCGEGGSGCELDAMDMWRV